MTVYVVLFCLIFFFKQKTAYEMRISDWSSDVCSSDLYTQWSTVMQHEYERLRRHRRPPVFDTYGGQSPGEFFGVVSEAFIQRPVETRRHHAELYALLASYYRLAPAQSPAGTGQDRKSAV